MSIGIDIAIGRGIGHFEKDSLKKPPLRSFMLQRDTGGVPHA